MTLQISKSAKNLNAALKELRRPVGTAGNLIMQSDSMNTVFQQIGAGRKNLFLNGTCQVAQRQFSASSPPSSYSGYWYDMWKFQSTSHSFNRGFSDDIGTYYLQMQRSDDAATTALAYAVVEASTGHFRNGEQYTISFLYTGTGLNFEAFFRSGTAGANVAMQVNNVTLPANEGNWARYEVTFTVTGRVDAQTAFNMRFGSYNLDTFRVSQVQLEKGNRATPYEHRPYGEELELCKRYLHVCHVLGSGVWNGTTTFFSATSFPVSMRAIPTVNMLNSTSNGGGQYAGINIESQDTYNVSSIAITHANTHQLNRNSIVVSMEKSASGPGQDYGGVPVIDADNAQAFVFSAEL